MNAPALRTPLVEGALAEALTGSLHELVEGLSAVDPAQVQDVDLAGGAAGFALLWNELDAWEPRRGHDLRRALWLDRCEDLLASRPTGPSLWEGFTGVAWVFRLCGEGHRVEALDEALDEALQVEVWEHPYDLIGGLVGVGLYALDGAGEPLRRAIAERAFEHLDALATRDDDGRTWYTDPAFLLPGELRWGPQVNLGLAHGVPGALTFLAGCARRGVHTARARAQLGDAARWMLAHTQPEGAGFAFASKHAPRYQGPVERGRDAWCYGDFGLSSALWEAGSALDDRALTAAAEAVWSRAAQRSVEDWRLEDPGLCHGAAGVAHLFHRYARRAQSEALAARARAWFARALSMRREGEGIAGYARYLELSDGTARHLPEAGLLTGAAGVALAYCAALRAEEPRWDRVMALSSGA